jgi:hypothetical protein
LSNDCVGIPSCYTGNYADPCALLLCLASLSNYFWTWVVMLILGPLVGTSEGLNYSLAYDAFLGHEPVLYSILKSVMLSSVACALLIPLLHCWPSLVVRAEL